MKLEVGAQEFGMADQESFYVEIRDDGNGTFSLTFPPGIRAVIRKRVRVDELLRVLRLPNPSPPDESGSVERAVYRLINDMTDH